MTDRDLVNALDSGQFVQPSTFCPCGSPRSVAPPFHKRSTNHDCVHHPRYRCWTCIAYDECPTHDDNTLHVCRQGADRLIAGVEARLYVEVTYGPFEAEEWR